MTLPPRLTRFQLSPATGRVIFPLVSKRLKHRWRLDNNLVGITAGTWWRLLRENGFSVDPAYWHRVACITLLSLLNSLTARRDERLYDEAVRRTEIAQPPLFILGHWRTGTTHLHNLLTRDLQFAFPNPYQAMYPSSFLSSEGRLAGRKASNVVRTRITDEMALGPDLPAEDEWALALSCLMSPYLSLNFPRHGREYQRYLTFHGVPVDRVEEWKRTLLWFVKKLTFKHQRPLVLKSPTHTARIRLLLELFPEARFVNIRREPYTVFLSTRRASSIVPWYMFLQKPPLKSPDDTILEVGRVMFDAYFDQRHLIPAGRLVDVAYEDIEARPVAVLRDVYDRLGLTGFEAFRPRLQAYVDSLSGYRKNRLQEIPTPLREKVATAWRRTFEEWNYPV